ncbi:MAG TPA: RNA polymerase sigma factor [Chitinophagaceae bacterium]|nr:RNA polymerase sigma factor [Chitinophagaceae bacterium]
MTRTNANFTEEELIAALHSGNHQSFEKLYNRFSQVLFGTILTWVSDSHVAENLLQDAFVKAWANRETYDPAKGRLFTWLYNISRNVCIDYYRSRQYKKGKAAILSDDISLIMNTKLSVKMPDAIGLRKLLDMLRNEERQVVELMYFKGFTQKEIAKLMNMPLGTVKTRMSMAIKNLRSFFMNDWSKAQEIIALNN